MVDCCLMVLMVPKTKDFNVTEVQEGLEYFNMAKGQVKLTQVHYFTTYQWILRKENFPMQNWVGKIHAAVDPKAILEPSGHNLECFHGPASIRALSPGLKKEKPVFLIK